MVRKLSTRSPIEVEDEETKQTKAWRWAFSHLRVRGDLEAELAHSLWNSMKAALRITLADGADLHTSLLKLSIACNHSHGSFLSGDRAVRMRECLQACRNGFKGKMRIGSRNLQRTWGEEGLTAQMRPRLSHLMKSWTATWSNPKAALPLATFNTRLHTSRVCKLTHSCPASNYVLLASQQPLIRLY